MLSNEGAKGADPGSVITLGVLLKWRAVFAPAVAYVLIYKGLTRFLGINHKNYIRGCDGGGVTTTQDHSGPFTTAVLIGGVNRPPINTT